MLTECQGLQGDFNSAVCSCNFGTPILIDVRGTGFDLTSFNAGVWFDTSGCGTPRKLAWTARGSDDAFLVLDRNGNGTIDDGKEWFGNHTEQPDLDRPKNGFEALRVLDSDGDGHVGPRDARYAALQLWTDRNHNGRSEPEELRGMWESGIESISVDYRESTRRDRHGNLFKLRSRIGGSTSRFAYDVYFTLTESGKGTAATKPKIVSGQR
jgi:hypothetical protein